MMYLTEELEPITGWEEERESLFNLKIQTTSGENSYINNSFDCGNLIHLDSDLVQIGVSIERLGNAESVVDSTTHTTQKVSRKLRNGQNEDDHSRGYEMKM